MGTAPKSSSEDLTGGWELPASGEVEPWRGSVDELPLRVLPEFSIADNGEPIVQVPGGSTIQRAQAPTRSARRHGPDAVDVDADRDIRFPRVGERLAGFQLVSMLGQGAFATVYLAAQTELGGRLVALKVARALGDEPQWLARLQHAHIVPIHSVHDDPQTGLRLLCMPYLGGANLAQVLEESSGFPRLQPTGRSLVKALDRLERRAASASHSRPPGADPAAWVREAVGQHAHAATRGLGPPSRVRSGLAGYFARLTWRGGASTIAPPAPASGVGVEMTREHPARAFYRENSFIEASVFIAARLAEALGHAHLRGILHRDLKPSNILIAADGTPMLLDFNLSEAVASDPDATGRVGGTLPYMAPEHLRAFHPATPVGEVVVDERSDLYALGLILYEMLAGRHPFRDPDANLPMRETVDRMIADRKAGAPALRQLNPDVSPGLESILRVCLDPDPARRYPDAATLAQDLQRHLDSRPLAFAPEPSVRERASKWVRRHPEARSSSTIGIVALTLLLGIGAVGWTVADRLNAASARLLFEDFQTLFRDCQLRLNTTQGPGDRLDEGIALAQRALTHYGLDAERVDASRSGELLPASVKRLDPGEQLRLREQLAELLLLHARAGVAQARRKSPHRMAEALRAGIEDLDRAERIDPVPTAALYRERQALAEALGRTDEAARDAASAEALAPRTARDFYLEGTVLAALGRLDEAESRLMRAVALDARQFWAWFALGLCRFDQGRYAEAEGDFRACILLVPDFAWAHLNRGLALARSGRLEEARVAYDEAIRLDPGFLEARVNRALAALELEEPAVAEADLTHALAIRPLDAALRAARAEALARLGRRAEAEEDFAMALEREPRNASLLVARGISRVNSDLEAAGGDLEAALRLDATLPRAYLGLAYVCRREGDHEGALAQVNAALRLDANLLDAVQLRALLLAHRGDPAAEADADRLIANPTPLSLYNAACVLAVLAERTGNASQRRRARTTLDRALARGISESEARSDPDLAGIFGDLER